MGQQALNGVFVGSIYALFAIGYTLVFGVLDILNLAHAAVFTLAAFIALALVDARLPLWLALPLAVAAAAPSSRPSRCSSSGPTSRVFPRARSRTA